MKKGSDVLKDMLKTFQQRYKLYKANYLIIGHVMAALFPRGITLRSPEEHNRYHLFLMIMVKATRLANTNLKHIDSSHDAGVYAAMLNAFQQSVDDELTKKRRRR